MSKPTWEFLTGEDGAVIYSAAGTVATISPDLIAHKANARLIASAPDLLAALERLFAAPDLNLESLEAETLAAIEQARAAIARAKGGA